MVGMRRWIYLDTLKLIHKVLAQKTIASKTTFLQTLRASYLAKDKFSEEEAEMLAEMLTESRRQSSLAQKASQAHSLLDERIKRSAMQGSDTAVDSRVEKIVAETGAAKWASKQSGL